MPGRAARRRFAGMVGFEAQAELGWTFVDDPELPHFRLPVREPDVVVLALQGRNWVLSAEGALPFETVPVAPGRAKPRAVAQGVFDAAVRIGTAALDDGTGSAGRRRAGETLLECAFDLAVGLGDARRAADAALVLGDALAATERTAEAASWFEVAASEAERLRDPELLAHARDKRAAAGMRGRIELGRAPSLDADLAPHHPVEPTPTRARAEPRLPDGLSALDPARQIGLADALVAVLATPGLFGEEIDGGSGYWPGGIRARTELGLSVELVVFSEFGYRVFADGGHGGAEVDRRLVRNILDGTTRGDQLFSALLCALIDLEVAHLGAAAVHPSPDARLAPVRRDALGRQLDAHAFVLGERATRREPPSLHDTEAATLRRYVAEFPSRPAVPAIRALLESLGGPAQLRPGVG